VQQRELQKSQHVVTPSPNHQHSDGELIAQHLREPLPVGALLVQCLVNEQRLYGCHHNVLGGLKLSV
jgi:hypothetical protein